MGVTMENTVQFGDITIVPRSGKKLMGEYLPGYEIFIENKPIRMIYCDNIDQVVLAALSIKHEGTNSSFALFASRMLNLDSRIWYS